MPRTELTNAAPRALHLTMPPPPPSRPAARREGTPAPPVSGPRSRLGDWLTGLAGRVRDAVEAVVLARGARRVHEFADLVASARERGEIEAALVALAGEVAGACRVELTLDRDDPARPGPRVVALWPERAAGMTAGEVEALGYPLCLGLWCGDHDPLTLQIYARPGRGGRWPRGMVRRLTTLCAMAAAAERGLRAPRRGRAEVPVEAAAVRDATFLNAILPYALSQARRHLEPLTVFCVEVDGLAALRRSQGSGASEPAVRRVAEGVARALRGSDVVARLDDDRLVVVLPNTGSSDARTVAAVVRSAAASSCLSAVEGEPGLSASVGVACFPDDASEMSALLSAADEAVARARSLAPDRVATPSPAAPGGLAGPPGND